MKKLLTLSTILFIIMMMFSCYDDTGEDCVDPPDPCLSSTDASQGSLNLNVTNDNDEVTLQNIQVCKGDHFQTGTDCDTYYDSSSLHVDNGSYSAMATYIVNYNGTVYTIEAVDGVDLSNSSEDYCGGVTCYEEGSETLELAFDREAFIDMINNTSKECFIATAAYGSGEAWQVEYLRSFRDRVLKKYAAGRFFIREYYAHSPAAAEFISARPVLKYTVSGILTVLIYAMMHPYIFFAALFALAAVLILSVYALAVRRRRRPELPGAC